MDWRAAARRSASGPAATSRWAPPGAAESTNFAVYAPEATAVWVCLFDDGRRVETRAPADRADAGHLARRAARASRRGQRYGFRADGPWEPGAGPRFNPAKLLLDPYARAISGRARPGPGRSSATATGDRPRRDAQPARRARLRAVRRAARGRATTTSTGATTGRPRHRWRDTVIYELHVKGFTAAARPGARGAARDVRRAGHPPRSRLPASDLGVTAVELLPVHQFVSEPALAERGLTNYWGYNSIGFFAPHDGYSSSRRPRRAGQRVQGRWSRRCTRPGSR